MESDHTTLSTVRTASPFAAPPRVLVVAEVDCAGEAVALLEKLEAIGADAEVRFSEPSSHDRHTRDAIIVAARRGYRFTQSHADLERALLLAAKP